MKFISTRVHGMLDYFVSAILIASPWLLNFYRAGAESWVPVILGAAAILYSLLTNYELSISKSISMKMHLTLDALSGIFLAASPWIFAFSDYVYLPHLIFGILEIAVSATTEPTPRTRYTTTEY
jgi:hypothetical protein